jgi:hypothetical protein
MEKPIKNSNSKEKNVDNKEPTFPFIAVFCFACFLRIRTRPNKAPPKGRFSYS